MLSRLITTLGLIAGLYPAAAVAAERPIVVELYTSQGCSSCPPANAYLNELSRDRRDVLALAFHVTYWDRLAGKTRFRWKPPPTARAVMGNVLAMAPTPRRSSSTACRATWARTAATWGPR